MYVCIAHVQMRVITSLVMTIQILIEHSNDATKDVTCFADKNPTDHRNSFLTNYFS